MRSPTPRNPILARPTLRRLLFSLLALVPLTLTAVSLSDGGPSTDVPPPPGSPAGAASVAMPEPMRDQPTAGQRYVQDLLANASPQVQAGAAQYHLVCEACHGASGLGMAEGRLSFDPAHQYCERCHKPYNAPLWDDVHIGPFNSFNLGDAPAIRGPGALADLPNALVLYGYLKAAMPRYRPGNLTDVQYLEVTAFVSALRGDLPPDATLTLQDAADVALK